MKITKENPRAVYNEAYKNFMHNEIVKRRLELGLTIEQMAALLKMDPRSYIDIDHGKSACSGLTATLYMTYCQPDLFSFISRLRYTFDSIEFNDAVSYRDKMQVTNVKQLLSGSAFSICPRCSSLLDREFVAYCDVCGQALDWKTYKLS